MNQEKYTERMRGFLQSAQMLALREGHQRLVPDHLLKVLLDDPEGLAANLIQSAGGDSRAVHRAVEANLAKQPKVEGQGAGQIYMAPGTARVFDQAEAIAEKAGDSFVTVERMLMALALAKGTDAADALAKGNLKPQALEKAIAELPPDYRTALVMHDVEGMPNPDIAETLGISLPAVKSRVHRSRLYLRQRLADWMDSVR